MPNPLRGEHGFEFDGKELLLVYDYQAIANLEAHYDLPMSKIAPKLDDGLEDLLTILHYGLAAKHPEIDREQAKAMLMPYNARRVTVANAISLAYNGPGALVEEPKKKRKWWGG